MYSIMHKKRITFGLYYQSFVQKGVGTKYKTIHIFKNLYNFRLFLSKFHKSPYFNILFNYSSNKSHKV